MLAYGKLGEDMGMRHDDIASDTEAFDTGPARWAERLAEAASDYETIGAEAIAGLGCDEC